MRWKNIRRGIFQWKQYTYLTSLEGSGLRSEGSKPLMLSPLKEGISRPSTISVGLDRGLESISISSKSIYHLYQRTWQIVQPSVLSLRPAYLPLSSVISIHRQFRQDSGIP